MFGGQGKTLTVVRHLLGLVILAVAQLDIDSTRIGVLDGVVDGFLRNSIEVVCHGVVFDEDLLATVELARSRVEVFHAQSEFF